MDYYIVFTQAEVVTAIDTTLELCPHSEASYYH